MLLFAATRSGCCVAAAAACFKKHKDERKVWTSNLMWWRRRRRWLCCFSSVRLETWPAASCPWEGLPGRAAPWEDPAHMEASHRACSLAWPGGARRTALQRSREGGTVRASRRTRGNMLKMMLHKWQMDFEPEILRSDSHHQDTFWAAKTKLICLSVVKNSNKSSNPFIFPIIYNLSVQNSTITVSKATAVFKSTSKVGEVWL